MDVKVMIDYRAVLALGVVVVGTIFAMRMDPDAIKQISIHMIDVARNLANTSDSVC